MGAFTKPNEEWIPSSWKRSRGSGSSDNESEVNGGASKKKGVAAWFLIHLGVQLFGSVLAIIGFISAFAVPAERWTWIQGRNEPHAIIGTVAVGGVMLQVVLGLA